MANSPCPFLPKVLVCAVCGTACSAERSCCSPGAAGDARRVTTRFLSFFISLSSVFLKLLLHEIRLLQTQGRQQIVVT